MALSDYALGRERPSVPTSAHTDSPFDADLASFTIADCLKAELQTRRAFAKLRNGTMQCVGLTCAHVTNGVYAVFGTMAPRVASSRRMSATETCRGVIAAFTASAAVTPAAWPMVMQEAWTRSAE